MFRVEFDVLALTVQIMIRVMNLFLMFKVGRGSVSDRVFGCAVVFVLALLSCGCGTGPQAEFVFRDSTKDLIPSSVLSMS